MLPLEQQRGSSAGLALKGCKSIGQRHLVAIVHIAAIGAIEGIEVYAAVGSGAVFPPLDWADALAEVGQAHMRDNAQFTTSRCQKIGVIAFVPIVGKRSAYQPTGGNRSSIWFRASRRRGRAEGDKATDDSR